MILPAYVTAPLPVPMGSDGKELAALLVLVGPPRDLGDTLGLLDEVEALEALCTSAMTARWPLLPKTAQRALLAMAVARTRAVKDRPDLSPGVRQRLNAVINTFPSYAKKHSPHRHDVLEQEHAYDEHHQHAQIPRQQARSPAPPRAAGARAPTCLRPTPLARAWALAWRPRQQDFFRGGAHYQVSTARSRCHPVATEGGVWCLLSSVKCPVMPA
jgi:hypothetical protein